MTPGGEDKMRWKIFRRRQRPDFYRMLLDQAGKALEGLEGLEEYLRSPTEEQARRVRQLEKEGDELRRILIDELNRTFVTPFDREDIFALSRAIDDVLDYAHTTVSEMDILRVEPNDYLRRMASLIHEAGEEIYLAVQHMRQRPALAGEHVSRAKAFENRVENVYREALAELFSSPQGLEDVVHMLKLREIYRHLSNAADRGDEAANIIGDIIVKTA
jgi:predicted phosphate transport protein (TIGR00153 family)